MQALHDFAVCYKIIMPFMYFDNSVTCKVTATRVRDWQLNGEEEIFTKSRNRSEIPTCMSHISSTPLDPWLQCQQIFILQYFHVKPCTFSLVMNMYVLSMLLGHIYIKTNYIYHGGLLFMLQHFLFLFISTVTQWGMGGGFWFYIKSYQTNFILVCTGTT
jgi:hypothetical protein